jgi:hypothetical protein
MGISSSTESAGGIESQQRDDVRYLGERMPFGDVELWQVYRAYLKLLVHEKRVSFLADVGILSMVPPAAPVASSRAQAASRKQQQPSSSQQQKQQQQQKQEGEEESPEAVLDEFDRILEERLYLLEGVEQKILPPDFGNALYRTCFLRSSPPHNDVSEYDVKSPGGPLVAPHVVDELDRRARLETFFEGLSNCTRRGSTAAVKCMIRCCKQYPPLDAREGSTAAVDAAAAAAPPDGHLEPTFAYDDHRGGGPSASSSSTATTTPSEVNTLIDPMELVNMGYRVSLAAAFLKATTTTSTANSMDRDNNNKEQHETEDELEEEEDEVDVGRFLPPSDDPETIACLQVLANSLSTLAAQRRQRMTRGMTTTTPPPPATGTTTATTTQQQQQNLVDEGDVLEWAEQVAPMFGSILPTFLHLIFFPRQPVPPSRTTFDYPHISQESTIFPHGSSPLLFAFGCMSPALGGEVRFFVLETS